MARGIGVYVGRKHVVAVSAVQAEGGGHLEQYAIEPITPFAPASGNTSVAPALNAESQAIQRALQKIGAVKSHVSVAMSPLFLVTRYFSMPSVAEKEKEKAIRYEATRYTKFKLSESVCEYDVKDLPGRMLSVVASAIKSSVAQTLIRNLRQAGADPTVIEPAFIPLARTCKYFGISDFTQPTGIIWIDGDLSVSITLICNNTVYLDQDFRLTGDMEQDKGKLNDELQGSFRYLKDTAGDVTLQTLYVTGFGDLNSWGALIQELFPSIAVALLSLPVSEDKPEDAGAVAVAFGLALGDCGWKSPLGAISLLPVEERKMRPAKLAFFMGFIAAATFSLYLLLALFVIFPLSHNLSSKKKQAEQPLSGFGADAARDTSDLESSVAAIESRFDKLNRFQKNTLPVKSLLFIVANEMPPSMWLESIRFEVEHASRKNGDDSNNAQTSRFLVIDGYAYLGNPDNEAQQVNMWAQGLAQKPEFLESFGHLVIDEIKQEKKKGLTTTHFSVSAEV